MNKKNKKILVIHFFSIRNIFKIPKTVLHSLKAFKKYSEYQITYLNFKKIKKVNFDDYQVVVMHYYSQVYTVFTNEITEKFANYNGLKIFFAQDDYDDIHINRQKYLDCKIDVLYTPVSNKDALNFLYPPEFFSKIEIISYLTGYCEERSIPRRYQLPYHKKSLDIFYRGNDVGFAYGRLGMEKYRIGVDLLEKLTGAHLNLDISCNFKDQIFGKKYFRKMGAAKATLVTESGSSILFDTPEMMEIRSELIRIFRSKNQIKNLDEIKQRFHHFFDLDGKYIVSEISPKAFEAIICKTAIIAFPGKYSGILVPDKHYIVLEKDYSNLESVIEKIKDIEYINQMTKKAYEDIVSSGLFSYKSFIDKFDCVIKNKLYQIK